MHTKLAKRLEQLCGHPPPFSDGELGNIEQAVLSYSKGIDAVLPKMTGLRSLACVGCEWDGSGLNSGRLFWIDAAFSSVSSMDLTDIGALTTLDLRATLVRDVQWILEQESTAMETIYLQGCPLSEASFHQHCSVLRSRVNRTWGEQVKVVTDSEDDWKISLLLANRGIDVVYLGTKGKVAAPGLTYSDQPDLNSWAVTHDDVKRVLDQVDDGDLSGFMDRCRDIAHGK